MRYRKVGGKPKEIFVQRQEKTQTWQYGYRKIGVWLRYSSSSRIQRKLFWKWSICLSRTSTVTSGFNNPSKDYINFINTYFSAEMMSTENESQNSGR